MDNLSAEIRRFRLELGETQESLAHRMGLTVRTIARYEADQPPKGKALKRFIGLAKEAGKSEFVETFWKFTEADYGLAAARQMTDIFLELVMARRGLSAALGAGTLKEARAQISAAADILRKIEDRITELDPYRPMPGDDK